MKLFYLLVSYIVFALHLNASVVSFDLKKTVTYALEKSPTFDSLKHQLSISDLEEKVSFAKFLPSLDLSATHGISDTSPRTTGPWSSDVSLSLTESLYDNGVSYNQYQVAKIRKNQSELNFEDNKNKASLEVASQFLLYSLNVKLAEIQEGQFKLVSKQFEMISKKYHQGLKTKNDFLRFKTEVSRSEINLVNAKNNIEKSKQELQRLMGIDLVSNDVINFIPVSFNHIKNDLPEIVIKLENHPQFRAAELQKEINSLDSNLVERKNWPEWFATTGISYGSSDYLKTNESFNDNDQLSWNALITVKYNFFDWGARSKNVAIAHHKNIIANNEINNQLLKLKSEIKQLEISVLQVKKNFILAKELLTLEKNNMEFIEREYRNGKIQYLDLINGLNNLSDAEIKYYTAAYDLQTTKYTVFYQQGKLYDELIK